MRARGPEGGCLLCLLEVGPAEDEDAGEVSAAAPDAAPGPGAVSAGGRFGHFEIDAREDGSPYELGRGAMGVTYHATDTTLHRAVALKVVNPDLVRDVRVRARFLREARAAAGLRHPGVASVFFFGERAEDGQLFYAMELVEGETLHARVRRCGGLPAAQVLEIGAQVAEALAAAEARGLTHRDLKPGNLMLIEGETINVKVIDFGLAKVVAADAPALTDTQGFVGTPAFASPEQGNIWQETDARSDFYALGATLWYALTGQPPFAGRTPGEIHRRQRENALPLDQLRAARVPPLVVALLRTLLSADPAGRPQTTRELAAALADCRRAPLRRRARWLALAAGVVLALLVGWGALSYRHTGEFVRQNERLQSQASAQQQQLDALQAQLQQQTQLIALVNAKLERSAAPGSVAVTSAQVEAAQERGIDVATLQKQLAGEQADVRALLVQIDQHLAASQTQVEQWRQLKCTALTRLGEGEYAAGRYASAVEPYQQALALIDAGKEPLAWCDAAGRLAFALEGAARYAEAAPLLRQVVERRTAIQGPEHSDTLKAMRLQARVLYDQGSLAEAEALYGRVLEAQERTLGKEDRETLSTLDSFAGLLSLRGQNAKADALGRRCLETCERVFGPEDLLTLESITNLAATLYNEGRYAEAAALNRRVLAARERLLGVDHPHTLMSVNNLANDLFVSGDLTGAEPLYRRSLAAEERTEGPEHPATLRAMCNLAAALRDKGDLAGAEELLRRGLPISERTLGPEHPFTLTMTDSLALVLQSKGDLAGSEALHRRVLDVRTRTLGPDDPATLASLNDLAMLLATKEDYAEAELLYRRALEGRMRTEGPDGPNTLAITNNLGLMLANKGDLAAAEPLYRRALEGRMRTEGPDDPNTIICVGNLAQLLDAKGDLAGAEAFYVDAQARMERVFPPANSARTDQEHAFALFREKQGRLAEALALAAQAAEGARSLPADNPDRRTYEEHYRALQAKVAAVAPSPTPTPSRTPTAR